MVLSRGTETRRRGIELSRSVGDCEGRETSMASCFRFALCPTTGAVIDRANGPGERKFRGEAENVDVACGEAMGEYEDAWGAAGEGYIPLLDPVYGIYIPTEAVGADGVSGSIVRINSSTLSNKYKEATGNQREGLPELCGHVRT